MQRRIVFAITFGLIGTVILVSLGIWQVQRLAWKEAVLSEIDARIADAPVALPARPDPVNDKYLPVEVNGRFAAPELHVLVGAKDLGAGYRVIQPFETEGRLVMVDRGFIDLEAKDAPRPQEDARIIGNLHWPDEVDGYTPAPDTDRGIWFARDVAAMAAVLGTEPVLIIMRQDLSEMRSGVTPLPVDTARIPNDHLQYAVTWFSLATIWSGMTGYFLWRSRRAAKGDMT